MKWVKNEDIDRLIDGVYGSVERIILDFIIVFLILVCLKILNIM